MIDINALARAPRDLRKATASQGIYILNNEICVFDPSGKPLSNHHRIFIFGIHGELLYLNLSSERQYFSFYGFAVIGGQKSRFAQETVL